MKTKNNEKIDFKYNLSVYWSLLKKYKFAVGLVILISILFELRFLADKFLFKTIIDKGTEFISGNLAKQALISIFIIIAVIFLSLVILTFILNWLKEHLIIRLETRMMLDLKQKFFNHLIDLHYDFHTTHKTGSLISRLLRGGWAIERMTDTLIYEFSPLIINIIVVTASLIYFDWISAIVVVIVVISFVLYSLFLQKLQETPNLIAINAEDTEKANVSDFLTNIDSIKNYGKEKQVKARFAKMTENTRITQQKHWDYFRWFGSVQNIILGLGTFFVIFFSIKSFLAGQITIGTLVFIFTAYMGLISPMFMFVHGIRNYYRAMADFQDLFQYEKIKNKIKDKINAKQLKIKQGAIEFKNVDFKYGKRKIFENFNLKIKANEKIALVGHSGSGKTTLIRLLKRLYDVDSGAILIDRENIKEFKQESLRKETGIVPQEAILFDDTLYNNIKFADINASKQEVMNAIKFAQLDNVIKDFPKKEDTIVGERGVKLSGGEKQRVSIARAILANKKVLILDEATSSLDSETEYEIQKDFQKLLQGRTSIIIAHRLSTIMSADRIIVLKAGKIVQDGSHSELIKQPGEYKKLWNLQKGGYIK